jgi:2-dehydropantoate 2-reductase
MAVPADHGRVVALLGAGGVGGALALRLAGAGHRVVCIARAESAAAIARDGLTLEHSGRVISARPEARERLEEAVDLLVVAVKAPDLERALERIDPAAVNGGAVLPLLNGLEHVDVVRAHLGRRVVAGSISRFEAYRVSPTRIVQATAGGVVTMASGDLPRLQLERAAAALEQAGFETRIWESESAVLWDKAARLAVLAVVTALTQRPVGELREDPEWRPLLETAIAEACAVAAADGVALDEAAQWAIIDGMAPTLTTSTARDVAAGRPSELDAIAGAVVRAGARHGVPCPTLEELLGRCLAS